MLIEFKCTNFLSFKGEAILNMTTIDAYDEHADTHIVKNKGRDNLKLLKSIAIYGSNGGGKSNFLHAMGFMKTIISTSFKNSLDPVIDMKTWNYSHRLSTESVNKPISFEMSFIIDRIIYRYGFSIQNWTIVSEWLYRTDKRETMLFDRKGMDFKINNKSFTEGDNYKQVNPNVLFLSYLAQHNATESSSVFNWFRSLNVMDGLENNFVKNYTRDLLEKNSMFKKWVPIALRFLEISDVEIEGGELVALHNKFD